MKVCCIKAYLHLFFMFHFYNILYEINIFCFCFYLYKSYFLFK